MFFFSSILLLIDFILLDNYTDSGLSYEWASSWETRRSRLPSKAYFVSFGHIGSFFRWLLYNSSYVLICSTTWRLRGASMVFDVSLIIRKTKRMHLQLSNGSQLVILSSCPLCFSIFTIWICRVLNIVTILFYLRGPLRQFVRSVMPLFCIFIYLYQDFALSLF